MVKLIAITGCKKSGKTSLIEQLLGIFTAKGYRVGVIKSSHHTIETDRVGTDSWRLREAGAARVMLTWPGGAALPHFDIRENDAPRYLADLCMDDLDLVFLEGFKGSPLPKIFIQGNEEDFDYNPRGLFATVRTRTGAGSPRTAIPHVGPGDRPESVSPPSRNDIPCFDPDDIAGIADCIEERLHWNARKQTMSIKLRVDGKNIGLKGFVRDIISSSVVGMVKTLKGCNDPGRIEITIDLEETEEK